MIEKELIGNVAVIRLTHTTKVNAMNSDTILEVLEQNLRLHNGLILNLDGVVYFDSTGFNMLLKIHEKARKIGKKIAITGISSELIGLFQITKLDTVFEIYPDVNQAINKINNQ